MLHLVPERTALLVIDMQPDYTPGGVLRVAAAADQGEHPLAPVRALMETDLFGVQVATQDWHPPDHVSFASNHPGHAPLSRIEVYGHEQILWPDHCVQGTAGAALHPDLPPARLAAIVRKGMDPHADSYSSFRNNVGPDGRRPPTGLAGYLHERGIDGVVCCGLARDVCVKWTAEDAIRAGLRSLFVWDLTWQVDPDADDATRAALKHKGIEIVTADMLPRALL
jgi:nicotinamidase/pyrazinamidase